MTRLFQSFSGLAPAFLWFCSRVCRLFSRCCFFVHGQAEYWLVPDFVGFCRLLYLDIDDLAFGELDRDVLIGNL